MLRMSQHDHVQDIEELAEIKEEAMTTPTECWLIETYKNSRTVYYTGQTLVGAWSVKPDDAVRFCRQQDAEKILAWQLDSEGRVTEHMWVDMP